MRYFRTLLLFIFISLLNAEDSINQRIIMQSDGQVYLTNQNYICKNLGMVVDKKFIKATPDNIKKPISFSIDDVGILKTTRGYLYKYKTFNPAKNLRFYKGVNNKTDIFLSFNGEKKVLFNSVDLKGKTYQIFYECVKGD